MEPENYEGFVQQEGAPTVVAFFDKADTAFTSTFLVVDKTQKVCAVVDPAYNFDLSSGVIKTQSIDKVIKFIQDHQLKNLYVWDTHAHADHLTAAQHVKEKVGGEYCVGANIVAVQKTFAKVFNLPNLPTDGSQFDRLLNETDTLQLGSFSVKILHTPGHTPACITYVIGDAVFCGDTIFLPDMGSARCDFPGGSASTLWDSVHKILALPPTTRIFVGHDYAPGGRKYEWETTVQLELENNKHFKKGTTKEEFLKFRETRDKELAIPQLLYPALQVNIRGGRLPEPDDDGKIFFKMPASIITSS